MGFLEKLFGPNVNKMAEKGDINGLIHVLDSGPSVEHRLAALQALADQPGDRPIEAFVRILGTDHPEVNTAAASALRNLGPSASTCLIGGLEGDAGDQALSILLDLGLEGVEPLRQALQSPSDLARRRAIAGIRELEHRLDDPEIREATFRTLLAALGDRSAECRADAANGLEAFADPRAGRALAAQLKDGDAEVRAACSGALVAIGESATPYLADALADRNVNARRLAADLLGKIVGEDAGTETRTLAFKALLEHVEDGDPEVREHTTRSLHSIPAEAVINNRLDLLADPERSDRDEIQDFVLELLEHADLPAGRREAALRRIQTLGLSADEIR